MWKGRCDHIFEDIMGVKFQNFSGHMTLVTKDGQTVSFIGKAGDMPKEELDEYLKRLYNSIRRGDHQENAALLEVKQFALEADITIKKFRVQYSPSRLQLVADTPKLMSQIRYSWNVDIDSLKLNCNTQLPGELTIGCTCHLDALEAGITIKKFRVQYSPSRLQLVADTPKLMSQIRYSLNVDIDSLKLNCNTIFQAWDIVKDAPWFAKMKNMYDYMEEHSQASGRG